MDKLTTTYNVEIKIPSEGSKFANILVVGEAGTKLEEDQKRVFAGTSGTMAFKLLEDYLGFQRSSCYATYVVKQQVVFFGDAGKSSVENIEVWQSLLQDEISTLPNIKHVFIFGELALNAVLGLTGIQKWRGSIVEQNNKTYYIALNPSAVYKDEGVTHLIYKWDMMKFGRYWRGARAKPVSHKINPTYHEAWEYLHNLKPNQKVALDIETRHNETICIGLSTDGINSFTISFDNGKEPTYSLSAEAMLRELLAHKLSECKLIMQNGGFDAAWLYYKDRIKLPAPYFDTLLAHHLIYPTLPHSLGFLVSQYLYYPFHKEDSDGWQEKGNIDLFWEYNGKDVCYTYQIAEFLEKALIEWNLDKLFHEHIMPAQAVIVDSAACGLRVDIKKKEELKVTLFDSLNEYLDKFHAAIYAITKNDEYKPSPTSSQQVADLLYTVLKLKGARNDVGKQSVDDGHRTQMYEHKTTSDEAKLVLDALDNYKAQFKLLTTYANAEIDKDNRIRCEYKQFGTTRAPGRLSSSKTSWNTGMNLQNQPKSLYSMYMADPGYCFIYFDLSQAEARYVGWDAKIHKWIEQFERARLNPGAYDAHRALAADMWKLPYDDVPTSDYNEDGTHSIRYVAKRCRHGLNYRMQERRLAETISVSLAEGRLFYNLYHKITPELRIWWDRLMGEVQRNRVLYNSYGRPLPFLQRLLTDKSTEAVVAFRPQSSIGDKVVQTWHKAHAHNDWPKDAKIILNVHDALIGIAKESVAKTALSIMCKIAEEPIFFKGLPPMIIPAEPKISLPGDDGIHRWSTLKGVQL